MTLDSNVFTVSLSLCRVESICLFASFSSFFENSILYPCLYCMGSSHAGKAQIRQVESAFLSTFITVNSSFSLPILQQMRLPSIDRVRSCQEMVPNIDTNMIEMQKICVVQWKRNLNFVVDMNEDI